MAGRRCVWLTSRGYGVHSPLAYRWICHVLRARDSRYYAFDAPGAPATPRDRRRFRVAVAADELGATMAQWPDCPEAPCVIAADAPLDSLPRRGLRFTDGRESYIVDIPGLVQADYRIRFR